VLFVVVSFVIIPSVVLAQSLSLSNLNASAFPRMTAQIRAFDASGNRITSGAGFILREDGIQRVATVTLCPPVQPQPFSAVLTIDISGSMGQPRGQGALQFFPINVAKAAADAFIDAMPNNGSECAITAFETSSYIMSYFTQDRAYLKSAINALFPLQGTNYQDAFLNPITGAIPMAARARNTKRAIIFLTDVLSTAAADMVVTQAMATGVQVYCITIGLPAPNVLKDIVNRMGGRTFENIVSAEAAVQIYRELANTLSIDAPCTIEWTSAPTCNTASRTVTLENTQLPNVVARDRYAPPFSLTSLITVMPRGIAMGAVPRGTTESRTLSLTLNAGAAPVQVANIRSTDPGFTVRPNMFTLMPGQPQQITVSFSASDSSYRFTTFRVEVGNGCNLEFFGTAGFPGARPRVGNPDTLRLIQPNGGEEFLVGIDTVIRWTGVPPEEQVKLEYSIDAGRTWRLVTDTATGLRYNWNVPNTPSDNCLMRVTQRNTSTAVFSTDSLVVLYQDPARRDIGTHTARPVTSAQFDKSRTGNEVVTTGNDGKAFLWDGWSGRASSRAFDLNVVAENGPVLDASYNLRGELGIVYGGITANTGIVPTQLPGNGIRAALVQGNAPLRAIRFNPLVPNQFVITPSDPQTPLIVYSFSNLGQMDQTITRDFILENSQGGSQIASFTPEGQGIITTNNQTRQVVLYDMRQTGNFQSFPRITWQPPPGVLVLYVDAVLSGGTGLIVAATCSDRTIRFLRVSTMQSDRLEEFGKLDAPAGITSLEKSVFNGNGTLLVSTAVLDSRGVALLWDLSNPAQPLPLINGPRHGARVNTAFFSNDEPTTRVVTASEDGTAIIWFIREKLPLQKDESDRLWKIVRPSPQVVDIDMRRAIVGTPKDSVCLVLNNPTQYEIPIQQAFISTRPGQQSPFSIVSGNAPFSLATNGNARIEFRFTPPSVGFFLDTLVIITVTGERLTALIRGESVAPALTGINVDFGNVFVNSPRDTTVTAIITNIGQIPLTLNNPSILGAPGVFRLGSGFPLAINLAPGQSASVPLGFTPRVEGPVSGSLRFNVVQLGQATSATLRGVGISDGALLQSEVVASPANAVCDATTFLVPLRNIGNRDVVIQSTGTSIRALSGGTSSEFVIVNSFPITIPPNSTNAIVVRFQPQVRGMAQAVLNIISNSLSGDVRVNLVGRLERDSLVFSDRVVRLDSVEPRQTTSLTISIRNAGNAPRTAWFGGMQTLNSTNFTISAIPPAQILSTGATSQVRITFLGGQAGRTYTDFYNFGSLCPTGGGRSDTLFVSVTVTTRPELRLLTAPQNIITCATMGRATVRFTNVGTTNANVTNIGIGAPFRIISPTNLNNLIVRPQDTIAVELEYVLAAMQTGMLTSTLTITGGTAGTLTLPLSVQRENVDFTLSVRNVDFTRLEANQSTTGIIEVVNLSSQPLNIASVLAARIGDTRFSIAPNTPIPPNSRQQLVVSFAGGAGNQTFSAAFPFEQTFVSGGAAVCVRRDTLRVTASTIGRIATLEMTDMVGNFNDLVTTRFFLRNRTNIPLGMEISDTVRFNVTMLFPRGTTPRGRHEFGERVIPVSWQVTSLDENVPLGSLSFVVLAGNDSLAQIRLMATPQTRAQNAIITTAPPSAATCRIMPSPFVLPGTHAATFCLLALPYVSGNSFVLSSVGTVSIQDLRPQPVSAEMTLDFWSREAELYVVRVTDAMGQTAIAEKQITSLRGLNTLVFPETALLPRGVYFVYLRNARELAARRFMIVR
jgi:WD40 repeat protein